jgi:hypothetical protein
MIADGMLLLALAAYLILSRAVRIWLNTENITKTMV